jgi:hypothetical protein
VRERQFRMPAKGNAKREKAEDEQPPRDPTRQVTATAKADRHSESRGPCHARSAEITKVELKQQHGVTPQCAICEIEPHTGALLPISEREAALFCRRARHSSFVEKQAVVLSPELVPPVFYLAISKG